jgi:two-component system OmpR family response regulator
VRTVADMGAQTQTTGERAASPTGDDVQLIWWPDEAEMRSSGPPSEPRLLLVAPEAEPPPRLGFLEDWLRLPRDASEFATRRAELLRRQAVVRPLTLDDDGLVHRGAAWVALSPLEVALIRPLIENPDRVVTRAELLAAARPHTTATTSSSLDTSIRRLRRRLRPLDVAIHSVRGVGHVLEVAAHHQAVGSGQAPGGSRRIER